VTRVTKPSTHPVTIDARARKLFDNGYGYFSDDGGEYIITRPDTPKPWVNVICPGDYGLVISQVGGGYSWQTHAGVNRVTRWEQDLVSDSHGKYLYIRDEDTGAFWSPTWKPVCCDYESYECRHGMGYSVFSSVVDGVQAEMTVTVSPSEAGETSVELWQLTLTNLGKRDRKLSVWSYLEWCLGVAPDTHREFHKTFLETEQADDHRAVFATKRMWDIKNEKGQHWNKDWDKVAFHAVNVPATMSSGNKEAFIGQYGTVASPLALKEGGYVAKTTGRWDDSVASLSAPVALKPGESKSLVFTLGVAEDKQQAERAVQQYQQPQAADTALAEAKHFWSDWLERAWVETPDDGVNLMANRWFKYQSLSSRIWGRTAYYQTGGAYGYRDQLQDSQLFLHLDPDRTKAQIMLHASRQYAAGHVQHWWHPITEDGLESQFSDDLLWLPFVTVNYLKETADFGIFNETATYLDQELDENNIGSLYEHCCRTIERSLSKRSERGLPLIGTGDWNDGFSVTGWAGKGESVWVAQFLVAILKDFCPAVERAIERGMVSADEKQRLERYHDEINNLTKAVNTHGWDGKWYWAASCDDRTLVGSDTADEGKIHLNPQTWSVLSGIVPDDRRDAVLESLEKHLYRDYGAVLLQPAYSTPDPRIGYLTRYAAGTRENGGLYAHAAAWAIQMECQLKRPDKAWGLFRKMSPPQRGMDAKLYQCEPYVTAANVDGPDSPYYGKGGWTWYTGSSAWVYRVLMESIMGVRPTWEGLLIDPCIPSHWTGFKMTRRYQGHVYHIEVTRPAGHGLGVGSVTLDGEPIDGAVIPPPETAGGEHTVEVVLK
jgi:cellobiose phosphorylase